MVNTGDDMSGKYMELRKKDGRDLMNEFIVVPDDNLNKQKKYDVFVGVAKNLHWVKLDNDNLIMEGEAALSKYTVERTTRKKPRLSKILPPKGWLEDVPVLTYYPVWSICTDTTNYFTSSKGSKGFEDPYGGAKNDYNSGYYDALRDAAHIKKLKLSFELIEAVFGPIDAELRKQYKEANEHKYFSDPVKKLKRPSRTLHNKS